MKTEFVTMPVFRQLVESHGVQEFVILRQAGVYHLFAVNREARVAYYLKEARGCIKTWEKLDLPANYLYSLGINFFSVRNQQ